MAGGIGTQVLVTRAAGFVGRGVVPVLPGAGQAVASLGAHAFDDERLRSVVKDITGPAADDDAVRPGTDLKAGIATLWPKFSETAK